MAKTIELSSKAQALRKGEYKHYKGSKYEVMGVAIHSETLEEMVVYKALYGKKLKWVRPLSMFLEKVKVAGRTVPRFKYLPKS